MTRNFVRSSLELHLFFSRIMKEHSLFLQAGFMPISEEYISRASMFRNEFEKLLKDVVNLSNCLVSKCVLDSGEIVTEYTLGAEKKTSNLTGIPINIDITVQELRLEAENNSRVSQKLMNQVWRLNNRALELVNGLINLKERILCEVLSCKLFTANYPLLIEHIIREAKLYRQYIIMLQNGQNIESQNMRQVELFWNQIMMEHALFIRGLLDPTEEELIDTADMFAGEYEKLLQDARNMTDETMKGLTRKTIEETMQYRDFKAAGTDGILNCKIRSIILPLLADHVLREANHYLRLLKD